MVSNDTHHILISPSPLISQRSAPPSLKSSAETFQSRPAPTSPERSLVRSARVSPPSSAPSSPTWSAPTSPSSSVPSSPRRTAGGSRRSSAPPCPGRSAGRFRDSSVRRVYQAMESNQTETAVTEVKYLCSMLMLLFIIIYVNLLYIIIVKSFEL